MTDSVSGYQPRALDISVITTGGTAVIAVTGPIAGGWISNPPNLASQKIAAAENLYLDMTAAPGDADAAGNGSTIIIASGDTFALPALLPKVKVYINAATSGHTVSGEVW
ncbi:MAG: hypothetical protein ACREFB_18995 [Stellaceae bacterium]